MKAGKKQYMEFVFLTADEYQKLITRFGEQQTKEKIEELNDAIGSKGYKYKSHYYTILCWSRRNERNKAADKAANRPKLFPIIGKTCSKLGCRLPAVYKDVSGTYDHYYCHKHLPKEVKEYYG